MTWEPFETAPRDGTIVLAWIEVEGDPEYPNVVLACWSDGWYDASTGEYGDWFQPTHWMPMPDPPHPMRRKADRAPTA